jgi:DNA end-binding protein Ku
MSARAIGTATVSLGLVSIPIKLYAAGEPSRRISFNLLHKKCGSRLKQQYICPDDDEKVERDDMVKGYEFAKGQYVTFTPEELKALEEKASESIDITEFVPAETVPRRYVDRTYYLGPDKGGDRAYRLLSKALRDAGRVAIARYAARGKQYLVMIRPVENGLAMEQLLYADEVKPFSEVPLGDGEVKEEELKLAQQLIDQAASDDFHPENYKDDVRERVLEQIQRKVEGEEITMAPTEAPQTQVIDLMEALKASLASGAKEPAAAERKPAKRAGKKTAAKRKTKKASNA